MDKPRVCSLPAAGVRHALPVALEPARHQLHQDDVRDAVASRAMETGLVRGDCHAAEALMGLERGSLRPAHSIPCKKRPVSGCEHPALQALHALPTATASCANAVSSASIAVFTVSPVFLAAGNSPACSPARSSSWEMLSPAASPTRSWTSSPDEYLAWPGATGAQENALLDAAKRLAALDTVLTSPSSPNPAKTPRLASTPSISPHATTASTTAASAPQAAPARKLSDFSIEHILRGVGPVGAAGTIQRGQMPSEVSDGTDGTLGTHSTDGSRSPTVPEGFDWLQCTRYRPPKLPRKYIWNSTDMQSGIEVAMASYRLHVQCAGTRRREGPAQRRLGRNPRIPFSAHQVAVMEGRFRQCHYLSSADVAELSEKLELSENRVSLAPSPGAAHA